MHCAALREITPVLIYMRIQSLTQQVNFLCNQTLPNFELTHPPLKPILARLLLSPIALEPYESQLKKF